MSRGALSERFVCGIRPGVAPENSSPKGSRFFGGTTMNAPTPQVRYLRYLVARAHESGLPYLPIEALSPRQVSAWIDYLRANETSEAKEDRTTPVPSSFRPPWQDLPDPVDHEHVTERIKREDGIEQSVCTICGVSA